MAIHRLRLIIATLAALLVPAALAGPALAAHIRVEGKSHSIFQGNARPFVGTLRGHTTTKQTALGSLVTASRRQPFALGLTWSDCCGGAWKGFFVSSIDHVTPPVTAFWAFKLQPEAGRAAASDRPGSRATATCWSTTRPSTRRRARPSPRSASPPRRGSRPANGRVTFTVSSYDDAGTATPAAGARVRVNGVPHARERQRHADAAVCPRHVLGEGCRAGRHPLAEAVGARLIATAALAVIAAGCGRGASSVPPGPAAVQVSVTRDYGSTRLVSARAAPGQSALDALRRVRPRRHQLRRQVRRIGQRPVRRPLGLRRLAVLRERDRPRRGSGGHAAAPRRSRVVGPPLLARPGADAGRDRVLAGAVRARVRRPSAPGVGGRPRLRLPDRRRAANGRRAGHVRHRALPRHRGDVRAGRPGAEPTGGGRA